LSEKLRAIRERLELSQSEIAKEIGVENRATISGYERGEREPPLPILLAYSRLVMISTDILIDDEYTIEDIENFKGYSKWKRWPK
jgi:transcriptional regulator with XRE-family HTH domain